MLDAIPFNVRHELSNEYSMRSNVVVRFDGERFYWEIDVESRTDSVKPSSELQANFMTDDFNRAWNARRIFAWDGEKYICYVPGANHSMVDTGDSIPRGVNGPLTAGVIPWGYGPYTYENLSAAESSAVEKIVHGKIHIDMTIVNSDGSEVSFVLDAEKNYAVLSCSVSGTGDSVVSKQYSNYQLVSDNWVPTIILIERRETVSGRLLIRHLWDIILISGDLPAASSFDVSYDDDTLIEYFSYLTEEPQIYRYSGMLDTELLLADRLAFVAGEDMQLQNCATATSKYITSKLGRAVADEQLGGLVNEPNGDTSLYQIKQFMQGLGLYCRAVTTDIQTLRQLNGFEVILHIPGDDHFVAVERIDSEYVWIVDLADNRFYHRTDTNFFPMDWAEGTALIISEQPIQGQFTELDDNELAGITGGQEFYKCNRILQDYGRINCDNVGGECGGQYYEFFKRWGCGAAPNGSCSSTMMERYRKCPCEDDPPGGCKANGEWVYYYMRACG
ncbi:MAG: cysteine peptidase family C39 domain-containing protein [Planctomycetota bacterium]|jgi:hypothetical protein